MICEEHSLSVITPTKLPQKIMFRSDIDNVVKQSNSYEDFLKNMKSYGYKIKVRKYLYFKKQGNKNFTNTQVLGMGYTEDNIRSKIYGIAVENYNYAPYLNYAVKTSQRKSLK